MPLPRFEYLQAGSVEEAVSLLAENPQARLLAGGTDLLSNLKNGLGKPSHLIRIQPSALDRGISRDEKHGLSLGGFVRLSDLVADPSVSALAPALARAASLVGAPQHRSMGTLAGNLLQDTRCLWYNQSAWWRSGQEPCLKAGGRVCHAVRGKTCFACYHGDLAPVLMALEARAVVQGPEGERTLAVERLFSGRGEKPHTLTGSEILIGVRIPPSGLAGTAVYLKEAERSAIDFPIVGLALRALPGNRDWRVCFTAVDRAPVRSKAAEDFLTSQVSLKGINEADLPRLEPGPVGNSRTRPGMKRRLMGRLLVRAAEAAARGVNR